MFVNIIIIKLIVNWLLLI